MRHLGLAVVFLTAWLAVPGVAGAKIVTAKDQEPIPEAQGPTATATATCPAGSHVVSGGWNSTAGIVMASESRRVGNRSWQVTVVRYTNDLTPSTLTAFAYCDTDGRRLHSVVEPLAGNPEEEPTGATVRCPDGEVAISGGFRNVNATTDPYSGIFLGSFLKNRRAWRVEVAPDTDLSARAFAYCSDLRGRLGKLSKTVTDVDNDEELQARSPRCPGTISGGFRVQSVPAADNPVVVDRLRRRGKRWVAHGHDVDGVGYTLTLFAYCD